MGEGPAETWLGRAKCAAMPPPPAGYPGSLRSLCSSLLPPTLAANSPPTNPPAALGGP